MINNIICLPTDQWILRDKQYHLCPQNRTPDLTHIPTYISPTCLYVANSPSIIQALLDYYSVAPEFVGTAAEVALETLADGTQVPMAV